MGVQCDTTVMDTPPAPEGTGGAGARYRSLLEINNAVVSNLTRDGLFHAIALALRRVVPFERTAVFLHDPERNVLRLFVLESSLESAYFVVGLEMAPDESHVGWVFEHQRPLLRRDLARERQYPMEDRAFEDGVRSYVIVPLAVRGRSIGTLAVASVTPDRYSEADAAFLQEAAGQIALAVENMKAYEAITALHQEVQAEAALRQRAEEALRAVVEGTASATGADFFPSLVRHLAAALGIRYAFVAECLEEAGRGVRTLAFWQGEGFGDNFEYDVAGTPCRQVLGGEPAAYCEDLQARFPDDRALVELRAESYLGVPIADSAGAVIGHLAILDDRPMASAAWELALMRVFAARAGAEMQRLKADRQLREALAEVQELRNRLHAENVYLQEEIHTEHNFGEMVGSSPTLLRVLRKVEQVAPTDATVLISGETGAGKELIARAIHNRSLRRERPLVKVDCSAISAGLVESELFGHVKGAFTGAIERRVGRFELAAGGTIFLDEVGELPLETQVKLLRALQEHEFEPVGSSRTIHVDVRVIAATNRDLGEAVRAGRFRADLFYRLNVFPLEVPPLRDRPGDIPQLAAFFLARFAREFGKKVEAISPATLGRLTSYAWPGNVRELQNIVERGVILSSGAALELGPDLLPLLPPSDGSRAGEPPAAAPSPALLPSLQEVERHHILAALEHARWVVEGGKGAARILGLHPNTLRSRMDKLGIRRPRHESS